MSKTVVDNTDEMISQWKRDRLISEGLALAYFIFPHKDVAFQAVKDALNIAHLKNNEKRAHRRRWLSKGKYQRGGPTKTLFHENQMVQFIIYQELEKYEILHEKLAQLGKHSLDADDNNNHISAYLRTEISKYHLNVEDLIVRYLKSIILYTNNNTEDLVTAIACLVCNLQPKDASLLHSAFKAVSPNYFSKRKHALMKRLLKRFSSYLQIKSIDGKTSYFEGQQHTDTSKSRLLEEFFSIAKPWGSDCPNGNEIFFTERLNSWLQNFFYKFSSRYVTVKDHWEIAHLHAILCPDCFVQLMREMKYRCPRFYLALPNFRSHIEPPTSEALLMRVNDRKLNLTEDELNLIYKESSDYLFQQQQRRERLPVAKIAILADDERIVLNTINKEREILDLSVNGSAQFRVEADTLLLKIVSWDDDGQLPIAVLHLNPAKIRENWQHRIWGYATEQLYLNDTQALLFTISLKENSPHSGFQINLQYQDLNSNAIARLNHYFLPPLSNRYTRVAVMSLMLVLLGVTLPLLFKAPSVEISYSSQNSDPISTSNNINNEGFRHRRGLIDNNRPRVINSEIAYKEEKIRLKAQMVSIQVNNSQIKQSKWQLKPETSIIKLRLMVPEDAARADYYLLVKSEKEQNTIWRSSPLRLDSKNKTIEVDLQSSIFNGGDYRLQLQTLNNNQFEDRYLSLINIEIID